MGESEVVEGVQGPMGDDGELGLESEGKGNLPLCGYVQSSEVRRSGRTKSQLSRTISTRGRLGHPRPKSPLLRMAEKRIGSLKGRALRMLDPVSGQKRQGGRKARVLAPIPEGAAEEEGVMVVVGEEMTSDRVVEGIGGNSGIDNCIEDHEDLSSLNTQLRRKEEDPLFMKELIPAGSSADLALDLIASQPLQDMAFVGEQVVMETSRGEEGVLVRESSMDGLVQDVGEEERVQESLHRLDGEKDFPPLSKEGLRLAKEKDRNRGGEGKVGSGSSEKPTNEKGSWNKGGRFGGSAGKDSRSAFSPYQEQGDGFLTQGRRRGNTDKGSGRPGGSRRGSLEGRGPVGGSGLLGEDDRELSSPVGGSNRFSLLSSLPGESEGCSGMELVSASPRVRYMKLLPNGDYDAEEYEDEKDWECEDDAENEDELLAKYGTDKRGAALILGKEGSEDSKGKKGKPNSLAPLALCC